MAAEGRSLRSHETECDSLKMGDFQLKAGANDNKMVASGNSGEQKGKNEKALQEEMAKLEKILKD